MSVNYSLFINKLPNITNYDVYSRLTSQLPHWFGNQTFTDLSNPAIKGTVLNTILWGFNITALGTYSDSGPIDLGNYAQYQYILAQMRFGPGINYLMTDDEQLNLYAQDFFGNSLPRMAGENNLTYKNRIFANIFNIKATREGMIIALKNLTGFIPLIFEPSNISDAMFYGVPVGTTLAQCAYDHGKYGSSEPYQAYIDVYIPNDQGLGNYPGYNLPGAPMPPYFDNSLGGYGSTTISNIGTAVYGSQSLIEIIVTIAQIAQVINLTKVYGTQIWFNTIYVNPLTPN